MNENGVLSFRSPLSVFLPEPFPLISSDVLVAPFWADHDVSVKGQIFYRFSEDDTLLAEVGNTVTQAFEFNFVPSLLFIATWQGVAQFVAEVSTISTHS